jgi:MFS family permease
MTVTMRSGANADAGKSVAPGREDPRADGRVIGLISGAHFLSHYLIYLLPPVLPLMKVDFGVSYAALGLIMTIFNLTSALTHVPMGFVVDRFGARRLLIVGVAVSTLTYVSMGAFAGYTAILILAAIAGVANSVYHPADYAIISAMVSNQRIGRAFSVHTFAGFAGGAVAPMVMAYVSIQWGWRVGLMLTGVLGTVIWLSLLINRHALSDGVTRQAAGSARAVSAVEKPGQTQEKTGVALLLSLPVVMCFLFFTLLSVSQNGLSTFAVAAFVSIQDISLEGAQMALTTFLVGSALGVLVGGQIADRTRRHEWVAALCFMATAVVIFTVGNMLLSAGWVIAAMALGGMTFGAIMPARDMLVRAVTPEGSMGKVFGFVSTGLNIGGAATPVFFGWLLDQGGPRLLFWFGPISMLVAALVAVIIPMTRPKALP